MRLTDQARGAFVRQVMDDVPAIDLAEEIAKIVTADVLSRCPAVVQQLWADAEMRHWLDMTYITVFSNVGTLGEKRTSYSRYRQSIQIPACSVARDSLSKLTPTGLKTVTPLLKKMEAQKQARDVLSEKLRSIAKASSTTGSLRKAVPEFDKYIPKEPPPTDRAVPVVTNVVAEFVKAGWPKGVKTKQQSTKGQSK